MNRHTTALIVASGLLLTGCTQTDDQAPEQKPADPTAAVLKVARDYQTAALARDWRTACPLRSARMLHGSVEDCIKANTLDDDDPSPTPTAEDGEPDPSPTVDIAEPPRYADGSTPHPQATRSRTPGEAERADTGPVVASDAVTVPATPKHPAGYGVLITYTVQWPGKPATTARRALRVVQESGTWVVDQLEDVETDVSTALSGG
ncbi:hypothetical protein [Streptomyces hydrogenans]|uniref:hypothetical protein n=1 Tax=Streptomyces hydrogenans TaxID=1873719 RepID=UPI00331CFCDF